MATTPKGVSTSPRTQFGADGGADPVEAGKKGGDAAAETYCLVSALRNQVVERKAAKRMANALIDHVLNEEKFTVSGWKEAADRLSGPVKLALEKEAAAALRPQTIVVFPNTMKAPLLPDVEEGE